MTHNVDVREGKGDPSPESTFLQPHENMLPRHQRGTTADVVGVGEERGCHRAFPRHPRSHSALFTTLGLVGSVAKTMTKIHNEPPLFFCGSPVVVLSASLRVPHRLSENWCFVLSDKYDWVSCFL